MEEYDQYLSIDYLYGVAKWFMTGLKGNIHGSGQNEEEVNENAKDHLKLDQSTWKWLALCSLT